MASLQTTFDAPVGNDPVALNLSSMGKGEVYVNEQSIGRYWVSFHTDSGVPSQIWYLICSEIWVWDQLVTGTSIKHSPYSYLITALNCQTYKEVNIPNVIEHLEQKIHMNQLTMLFDDKE